VFRREDPKKEAIMEKRPSGPKLSPGVRIVVHQIQNHIAQNQLRVMVAVLFDNNLLVDSQGMPVAFNTTFHDPNSTLSGKGRDNQTVPLVVSNPEQQGLSNKSGRSNVIAFHEEYRIFYDIVSIA
jgi:hypothetical protein